MEAGVGVDTRDGFDAIEHAREMAGRRFRLDGYYEVGREKVLEFAAAVQDEHAAHWDDEVAAALGYSALPASPTFVALLGGPVLHGVSKLLMGYDLRASVHTDQVLEFHRPVLVGDRLTSNVVLQSFRQAFGGDMLVFENVVTDQWGEAVVTGTTSMISRSERSAQTAEVAQRIGALVHRGLDPFVRHSPERVELVDWIPTPATYRSTHSRAVGSLRECDELPSRTVFLTLGDLVRYAGVAGDANPIHWHPDAARMVGLERGVVAHGMLTMAYAGAFVTSWLGDPGALKRLSVRMSNPVYVGSEGPTAIEFTGKVKAIDPVAGTAAVAITAMHEGRKVFGRATAVVQLS